LRSHREHAGGRGVRLNRTPRAAEWLSLVCGVAWAFLRRELATYASYRAKLSLGLASVFLSLVTFIFVGKVVASAGSGFVERYGMAYSTFAVLGILVHSMASAGLHSFRSAVRREQLQGTLEVMFATRLPVPVLVALSGSGELLLAVAGGACMVAAAAVVVGFHLCLSPVLGASVVLYVLVMCGAGLASAGFVLVFKEGEPVSWALGAATGLLGGVCFPVDLLPHWLQVAAGFLPTTRALSVVRSSVCGTAAPSGSLTFLALAAAASLTGGFLALVWGSCRAKRAGTLGHY
jgi:ABC-2 type transport system permease protein